MKSFMGLDFIPGVLKVLLEGLPSGSPGSCPYSSTSDVYTLIIVGTGYGHHGKEKFQTQLSPVPVSFFHYIFLLSAY